MTRDIAPRALLKKLAHRHSRTELKALFALIRTENDRALLAAPKLKTAKRGDPLAREIDAMLHPIVGRSREKADLLIEHMAKAHRRDLAFTPRGVADAVKRLRAAKFSDAKIRAGAKALVAELAVLYSKRETVV